MGVTILMIKLMKFLSEKIVIVEVMLLLLHFIGNYFEVEIPYLTSFLDTALVFLTPIAIVALIVFIVFSILDHKLIKILIIIVLAILIYKYYIG